MFLNTVYNMFTYFVTCGSLSCDMFQQGRGSRDRGNRSKPDLRESQILSIKNAPKKVTGFGPTPFPRPKP